MSGYWDGRRAAAVDDLFQAGADLAGDLVARHEQKKADARYQQEYIAAIRAAQQTGARLEARFQRQFAEDDMVDIMGIKDALLRELTKLAPDHPLVKKECRIAVADVTRIKFNRAGRPTDRTFDAYAPNAEELQRILDHYSEQEPQPSPAP